MLTQHRNSQNKNTSSFFSLKTKNLSKTFLPIVLMDGAQTSMAYLKSSLKTQWYSNDEQRCKFAAKNGQFFLAAAASNEELVEGHVVTCVIVCIDALQETVNALNMLICNTKISYMKYHVYIIRHNKDYFLKYTWICRKNRMHSLIFLCSEGLKSKKPNISFIYFNMLSQKIFEIHMCHFSHLPFDL